MATDAFAAVVGALARRDLTEHELDERLERAGFDTDARRDAIARAHDAGYVDDERVAFERARHLAERGASDAAIRADLRRRGLDLELVAAALDAVTPESERALRLATRFGGGPRAARALTRKGYREDVIERAIRGPIAEEW